MLNLNYKISLEFYENLYILSKLLILFYVNDNIIEESIITN